MESINIINNDKQFFLSKIENNAKEFINVPENLIDDDFIIQAIQTNTLVTRYLKEESFKNDRIAYTIALLVDNHKNLILDKLQEEDFYFTYITQKIKNKDISDKQTYFNKDFFSKKENVLKVIKQAGFFKMKYLGDNLKDNESIVHMFCEHKKLNQIYASSRIKKEAEFGGKEVFEYVKTKLFYERLENKFPNKHIEKTVKI